MLFLLFLHYKEEVEEKKGSIPLYLALERSNKGTTRSMVEKKTKKISSAASIAAPGPVCGMRAYHSHQCCKECCLRIKEQEITSGDMPWQYRGRVQAQNMVLGLLMTIFFFFKTVPIFFFLTPSY